MKKVEAIIRPEKLEDLKDALLKVSVHGMTINEVMGCGNQHGYTEYHRGSEVIINTLPMVKVEIVMVDEKVEGAIALIEEIARTGNPGDGKIFISTIDEAVRIRTGERGMEAI